jgi:hypothetical protein
MVGAVTADAPGSRQPREARATAPARETSMPDYQPLDLGAYRNAGADLLPGAPVGCQEFHGPPFEVGSGEQAFVLLT